MFSLQWGHVEKWLIQFWNRLLVRTKCTMCDFPNFSTRSNNSIFSSISGVFSALEAHRKAVDTVLESSSKLGTIVRYAISRIFQRGQIILDFLAFLVFSLQWGHLEKWLIHFWNRLLVRTKCPMCDFPNFSTRSNNYRFLSISGVFSAMGVPRKVVDTVLESSTHED